MGMDVVIVGAGAAGIAAAKILKKHNISFLLVEASQRVGGRAFTETMQNRESFDLGCHWLHSASINPFVDIANRLGVRYEKRKGYGPLRIFKDGGYLSEKEATLLDQSLERDDRDMRDAWEKRDDISVFSALDRNRSWMVVADYFTTLDTSSDVDQVSIGDLIHYADTDENWPVIDGYGTLVNKWASDIPVKFNANVSEIHWGGSDVRVVTTRGEIRAKNIILTMSTGVLGSGFVRFFPELPERKQAAIAALPLGNYNRIRLSVRADIFEVDVPERILTVSNDDSPMSLSIRPYGFNCVIGIVGGRYADWLERSGPAASLSAVKDQLIRVFGGNIVKHIDGDRQSAWRGDPFIRGAYSSAKPGQFHQRARLAETLSDKLFFAGEATSSEHFCTCHGAMITGIRAANELVSTMNH